VKRVALALALGAAGGMAFALIRAPLAWMLGAMTFTTIAALAGAGVGIPAWLRKALLAVLGVMLGGSFGPELLGQLGQWTVTLFGLLAYIVFVCGSGYLYLRRVGGYDALNSYFTAMPGGLNEMTALGHAMGGDDRVISLSHAVRLTLVVFTIPVWFRLFEGYAPPLRPQTGASFADTAFLDLLILAGCAVGGPVLGRLLRMPAPHLTGALLLSATLHMSGATHSRVPPELVILAQIGLGASLGVRFCGLSLSRVLGTIRIALGLAVVMLIGTVLISLALAPLSGIPVETLLLAFAPGGFAEMSLVALSLDFDTAFVATHQLARVLLVLFLAPLFFRLVPARVNVAE
jgi:membrane AbrB-like protein